MSTALTLLNIFGAQVIFILLFLVEDVLNDSSFSKNIKYSVKLIATSG